MTDRVHVENTVSRRDFLKIAWGAAGALALVEAAGVGLSFFAPRIVEGEFGGVLRPGWWIHSLSGVSRHLHRDGFIWCGCRTVDFWHSIANVPILAVRCLGTQRRGVLSAPAMHLPSRGMAR